MQRVVFSGNRGYKPSIEPASDRLFIPLAVINDLKAQKNGPLHNNILETGKKTKNMVMVSKYMTIKINMKATGKMILETEKVLTGYAQEKTNIENFIQEIGKITRKKDMVYIFIKTEVAMMENGRTQKEMEKV